jgi:hypothetical protein
VTNKTIPTASKKAGMLSSLFYPEEEFMYKKRVSPLPSSQVAEFQAQ